MPYIDRLPMLSAAIPAIVFLMGPVGLATHAEAEANFSFEERPVEFYNQDVRLAGSLLLPTSDVPVPAVVLVHGAGRQTREPYREAGEFFASQGIAALIYDKRGVGQSGGAYESHEPYTNLVNDALAAVRLLQQRPEIAPTEIGIWGLSQGAYISAVAASRSDNIRFIVAVGASVADGTKYYYRDNLFRTYGLSSTLRDVAEKLQVGVDTLPHNLGDQSLLSTFSPRFYPPPDQFVHPAWSLVEQPVLVMYGQLDQHQPVGESIAGLKNSLAQAKNEKWTIIVVPRAGHSLGISDTGEIQSKWQGYPPGVLQSMTDWVHRVIDYPAQIEPMNQVGSAEPHGVLARLVPYERLRWYGNGTVQAVLWVVFLVCFLANTIAGVRYGFVRFFRPRQSATWPASDVALNFKRAICALNLLILFGMAITAQCVLDEMRPSCPAVLMYLPLMGTISTFAIITLLILLVRTCRQHGWMASSEFRHVFDVLCLVLFVPYLCYWNLIGFRF